MATGELNVPVTEAEVTSEWLSAAMGVPGLEIDELERLGGNNPVVSQLFRAHVSMGCNMATAVVKIPSAREEDRRLIVSESGFARETVSYRMLERWQGGFVPRVLAEVRDEETEIAALVLEDLGKPFGSQIGRAHV